MKLSQIAVPHHDNLTDKLYQPLRKAINTYSPHQLPHNNSHTPNIHSDVRKSTMHIAPLQPNLIVYHS